MTDITKDEIEALCVELEAGVHDERFMFEASETMEKAAKALRAAAAARKEPSLSPSSLALLAELSDIYQTPIGDDGQARVAALIDAHVASKTDEWDRLLTDAYHGEAKAKAECDAAIAERDALRIAVDELKRTANGVGVEEFRAHMTGRAESAEARAEKAERERDHWKRETELLLLARQNAEQSLAIEIRCHEKAVARLARAKEACERAIKADQIPKGLTSEDAYEIDGPIAKFARHILAEMEKTL